MGADDWAPSLNVIFTLRLSLFRIKSTNFRSCRIVTAQLQQGPDKSLTGLRELSGRDGPDHFRHDTTFFAMLPKEDGYNRISVWEQVWDKGLYFIISNYSTSTRTSFGTYRKIHIYLLSTFQVRSKIGRSNFNYNLGSSYKIILCKE